MTFSILATLLVGCDADLTSRNVDTDDGLQEEEDDPPVIEHDAIEGTQTFGADVPIAATVTDAGTGVLFVYLHYKNDGDGSAD